MSKYLVIGMRMSDISIAAQLRGYDVTAISELTREQMVLIYTKPMLDELITDDYDAIILDQKAVQYLDMIVEKEQVIIGFVPLQHPIRSEFAENIDYVVHGYDELKDILEQLKD